MKTNITTVDRIAMALGGGLILLGTLVMGFFETILGNPSAVPIFNDAGELVAGTTFPVEIRAYIILLGLAVFFLLGVYKLVRPVGGETTPETTATGTQ